MWKRNSKDYLINVDDVLTTLSVGMFNWLLIIVIVVWYYYIEYCFCVIVFVGNIKNVNVAFVMVMPLASKWLVYGHTVERNETNNFK